ncbi:hypothetical protein [Flammeovirga agarivorans]|uniref:Uncharacterized protein n=1 Tax=Flammeovirga agarivorans TaxID=2726742 RepID=A0A7X8SM46_9BACT|nr:hypothetical protein [Flammeovirga agarivorans]NLR92766.1 hypothetical protein [Flammeovirga agarivorans]
MKNLIKLIAVITVLSFTSCNNGSDYEPITNDRIGGEQTPGKDKDPGDGDIDLDNGQTPSDRIPGTPEDGDNITDDGTTEIEKGLVKKHANVISENRNTHQMCDVYEISKEATELNLIIGENEFINIYTINGRVDVIKASFEMTLKELLKIEGINISELSNEKHWYKVENKRQLISTSIKVVKYTK